MDATPNDVVMNVVHCGIKQGIRVAFENQCFGSCVILIYSGIDAMAFLGMNTGKDDVTRTDFVEWVDRYIGFPCSEQISGHELYAARCAMLHTYGTESKTSRQGHARQIGYMDRSVPEIIADQSVSDCLVLVSVEALMNALFAGIDSFLIDIFSDDERSRVAEARFRKLIVMYSIGDED